MPDPTCKRLLTPEEIEAAGRAAAIGARLDEIAHIIGISKPTLDRRLKDQPGVLDAVEKGRAQGQAEVMAAAFKMATSGQHPVMTIFWCKTKLRWKENGEETDQRLVVPMEQLKRVSNG